jgi:hypothetical protein
MGTDLTGWVEIQRGYDTQWDGVLRVGPIVGRTYGMFGSLFGMRNEAEFLPIASNRGIPSDASEEVGKELADLGEGAVAPTWLLWTEIESIDWAEVGQEPIERPVDWEREQHVTLWEYTEWQEGPEEWSIRRKRKDDPDAQWEELYQMKYPRRGEEGMVFQFDVETRREVVTPGWELVFQLMGLLASTYGETHVRLVVWFDSV